MKRALLIAVLVATQFTFGCADRYAALPPGEAEVVGDRILARYENDYHVVNLPPPGTPADYVEPVETPEPGRVPPVVDKALVLTGKLFATALVVALAGAIGAGCAAAHTSPSGLAPGFGNTLKSIWSE
jgi:hypothetical protein